MTECEMNKVDYLLITLMEECAEIQKECRNGLKPFLQIWGYYSH